MSSPSNSKYKNYLFDLGLLLSERALEAKNERDSKQKNSRGYLFAAGRLLGYFEVISTMKNQAELFGIEVDEVNLKGINPEKDLL